jgi:C4-dicarboxylate-specific signal transduction histidine kinase
MAISSCTKQQKNTTVELAESSMAIRRRNNSRFDPTSEVLHIWARGVQLQQVLLNLMLNGIEAMKDTNNELTVTSP